MKHADLIAAGIPHVTLEHAPCPLGCPADDEPVLVGRDRISNLPGEFHVVRCRACGLLRTSPRPSSGTMGFYYPDDYGPYVSTRIQSEGKSGAQALKRAILAFGRWVFDVKAHDIPPIKPGRMLEIGCASGSYMEKMVAEGWQVEGIEFSPDAAEAARAQGLDVTIGALETVEKPEAVYDLVVGWMVLEHLHDPLGSLKKIARWTKPTGMLAISVPDAGATEFRLFKDRWYALHLPNHLFHFDRETLGTLLQASGWRVTRVQRHRNIANLIASLGYLAQERGYHRLAERLIAFPERAGRLGALLTYPFSFVLAALGQTGRMTVWAEREAG
jgi:2-polyprenyl-3-methyl-5-hydroxy-6-metoxy-1,4-benzoquinol methylase